MKLENSEISYLEQISGCTGEGAIDRWLYFTETFKQKLVRRPRYVLAAGDRLVPWSSDAPRDEKTGLPRGTREPERDQLLRSVIKRIRRAQHPSVAAKSRMAKAIADAPPSPCVKFACPKQGDCAERRLACYSFWWWSGEKGRRAISPWTFLDHRINDRGDTLRGRVLVTTAEPVATRGMFNEVFPQDDVPIGRPRKARTPRA